MTEGGGFGAQDRIRLQHLADALRSAIRFVQGRERSDLESDEMLLFALTRAIEIAGEAASRVSTETKEASPDLPWAAVVGMRNRLVHAYFDVDHDILWTTATIAAVSLLEKLEALIAEK